MVADWLVIVHLRFGFNPKNLNAYLYLLSPSGLADTPRHHVIAHQKIEKCYFSLSLSLSLSHPYISIDLYLCFVLFQINLDLKKKY
jgi:hypothetical protein